MTQRFHTRRLIALLLAFSWLAGDGAAALRSAAVPKPVCRMACASTDACCCVRPEHADPQRETGLSAVEPAGEPCDELCATLAKAAQAASLADHTRSAAVGLSVRGRAACHVALGSGGRAFHGAGPRAPPSAIHS